MQFIDLRAQYAALKTEIDANIQAVLNSAAAIARHRRRAGVHDLPRHDRGTA